MNFPSLLPLSFLLALLLPQVLSSPLNCAMCHNKEARWHRDGCLTDDEAAFLVDIMVSFSVKFDPDYAGQFLSEDFTVQSDSFNLLTNGALGPGELTAPSKAIFISALYNQTTMSVQPNIMVEEILHSCDEIAFRWVNDQKPVPVQGIDILIITKGTHLIEKDYSEFNNIADVVDAGYCILPCAS